MNHLRALAALLLAASCSGSGAVAVDGTRSSRSSSGGSASSSSSSSGGTSSTSSSGATTTTGAGGSTSGTSATSGGSICDTQRCVVYASADHDLYQVDPSTNQQTHLCTFNGALSSTTADVVTDLAVERQGTVYAITESHLYTVDPQSCAATVVSQLSTSSQRFVGLAFTAQGVLLGADQSGGVYTIDPGSGQVSRVGSFGGGLACSGDLVAINDANQTIFATAATIGCTTCTDQLVTLDPGNGYAATPLGDTGFKGVYGLGYWGGQLYGFTHGGLTLQLDPASGAATQLGSTSPTVKFSGGATTPLAPIVNR